jgi:hypothetical protein
MPFELAGIGVQRHDRIGIPIVAGTLIGIPVGAGIADSPISKVDLGIVGTDDPDRCGNVRLASEYRLNAPPVPAIAS